MFRWQLIDLLKRFTYNYLMAGKKKNSEKKHKQNKSHSNTASLEQKHRAYIKERFSSPHSLRAFTLTAINLYVSWLTPQTINHLLDKEKLKQEADAFLESELPEKVMKNDVKPHFEKCFTSLLQSEKKLEKLLPRDTLLILERMAQKPYILPTEHLNQLIQHQALRDLMGSLLYHAIIEFTIQVNPFFSSWGLPSLLKKTGLFGFDPFGMGNKVLDTIKSEFESQLEPQIKSFLSMFTGSALQFVINYVTAPENRKKFVTLQKDSLDKIMQMTPREILPSFKDEQIAELVDQMSQIIVRQLQAPHTKAQLHHIIDSWYHINGDKTVDEVTEKYGINLTQWLLSFAALAEPLLITFATTEAFDQLIDAFFEDFGGFDK